ncbi:MAG: DUF4012 domain-containing protein [Patescibacteria group bacterium]
MEEIIIPKIDLDKEVGLPKSNAGPYNKIFIIIGVVVIFLLVGVVIPSIIIYQNALMVLNKGNSLKKSFDSQNIALVRKEVKNVRESLRKLKGSYNFLIWLKPIPLLGSYYKDGEAAINAGVYATEATDLIITAVEPYADIIGFTGDETKKPKSGQDNAKSRIEFIVETIGGITPKLEEISQKVGRVKIEIDKINPNKYPEILAGKRVREKIKTGIYLVDEGARLITESKPLLEAAPYLLGTQSERVYLILFQNDKELRPTGGFITAYSIMKVNKGKFEPVSSDDIYNLDAKYKPKIPAPAPIIDYIKGPYTLNKNLRLRDMNFDPDFAVAMAKFTKEAQSVGLKNYDGIIAVDTQVPVKILDVIGQIGVPGFGNFSTKIEEKCNCPQVIYELESFADIEGPILWDPAGSGKIIYKPPNADNRKKIVGPLMNSMLANALGQPKNKLPDLAKAVFELLNEKHILFYMFDDKAQKGVESFNVAGRIKDYQGDYLHINDSNLGGRKSNLYVTQEVKQTIKVLKDKSIEKTVEITYKNSQDYDGWLNSILPNWTRVYVPKGSQLISAEGFEDKGEVYEEIGKTVFSGGFKLRPKGVAKILLKYKAPLKFKDEYHILVQKQPGLDAPVYTFEIGRQSLEGILKTDKEFRFKI